MAEPDRYVFTYTEIVEALIKKQGLHEGRWAIYMEFGIGGANAGPSEEQAVPAAIVPVLKVGLQRVPADSTIPGATDAAVVNPQASPPSAVTSLDVRGGRAYERDE